MVLLACCVSPEVVRSADEAVLAILKVTGNRLETVSGHVVHLHGVNLPSMEWSQGENLSQSLNAATEWGANVIRLPLSQDRWFGHTRETNDDGVHYQTTVKDFVRSAAAKKCYVILDLHWSDAGVWGLHVAQHNMPDENSIAFWKAVSSAFANNAAVLFDLYNEPHDVSWDVWRNGGKVVEESKFSRVEFRYDTPGMQKLLEVCREQGASNVIIAGGLDWAYDLTGIMSGFALKDTNGNGVIYDTHMYPMKTWYTNGNVRTQNWDRLIEPATKKYPVIVGEFGNGEDNYTGKVLDFAKQHDLAWVAWCFHPRARPCLIKNWEYTPTEFGAIIKDALQNAGGGK
jgi:hypothetical protein